MVKFIMTLSGFIFIISCGSNAVNSQETSSSVKQDSTKKVTISRPPIPVEEKAPDFFPNEILTKEGVVDTVVENLKNKKAVIKTNSDKDATFPAETESSNLKEKNIDQTRNGKKSIKKPSSSPIKKLGLKDEQKTADQRKIWNQLLQKHVSFEGKVNYAGFINDKQKLNTYLDYLKKNEPDANADLNSKLAYWMNAYNAFTVKLIIDHLPLESIKDIKDPWGQRFFQIGSKWYNLNEIEHKILRKMNEPRIHFGINCASISCPKLLNKAFTPSNVQNELEILTASFINDATKNTISSNQVIISKIFDWFAKDFKKNESILHFLNRYAQNQIATGAKIKYKEYNWNLNN